MGLYPRLSHCDGYGCSESWYECSCVLVSLKFIMSVAQTVGVHMVMGVHMAIMSVHMAMGHFVHNYHDGYGSLCYWSWFIADGCTCYGRSSSS